MSVSVQYLLFVFVVTTALVVVFYLMKQAFLKYRNIHINSEDDISKYHYRHVLYFWAVGIFVPASELYVEIFKIRKESELLFCLLIGLASLGIVLSSKYCRLIHRNLGNLFIAFFVIYNLQLFCKIGTTGQMEFLTLAEFTMFNMLSYYVLNRARDLSIYFFVIIGALVGLLTTGRITTQDFIIYFNSSFIAFIVNYIIYYTDLSVKENLLFAYNFVNKGNLFVIGVNNRGLVTFISKNVKQILGYDTDGWIGKSWALDIEQRLDINLTNGIKTQRIAVEGKNCEFFDWTEEVFNDDLTLKIGRDITAYKRAEDKLQQTNNRLESLLSNIGDLVFVLDTNYVFTEYYDSEANGDCLVASSSKVLGKKFSEIGFPNEAYKIIMAGINKALANRKKEQVEYCIPSTSGKEWCNMLISPICDANDQPVEIICIVRNINDSKNAEIELRRTKELLEQTGRVAKVGGWEYDVLKEKIISSQIARGIYDLREGESIKFDKLLDFIDGEEYRNLLEQKVRECASSGTPYNQDLPIISYRGNKRWVKIKGAAELVDSKCVRLYGIVQDIDDQVKAKNALMESEEKFRFISENTSDVIGVFENGELLYVSPSHENLFGYSPHEAIEQVKVDIYGWAHPDDIQAVKALVRGNVLKRIPSFTHSYRFLHKNGHHIWREDTVDLIYGVSTMPLKTVILARDITERKNREIEHNQRQEKLLLQNTILIRLSKTHFDDGDFFGESLHIITQAASEGMEVNRVGIWTFEQDKIVCADLYSSESSTHTQGNIIAAQSYPIYFEAIQSELAVIANDAHTHEHTCEFSEPYLKVNDIRSMLDLPFYIGGQLAGVICWEQTQEPKVWTDEDVAFARSIADIISIGIEASKRKRAEIALQRVKELLEQTSQIAKVGGWEIDIDSQSVYFSDTNNKIIEAPEDFKVDLKNALNFYKSGENRDKIYTAIMQCYEMGVPFEEEVQIITLKGNERWIKAIGQAEYENGKCKRLYGTFQDIDEQTKLVQIIKDKEQQYRTLISNISSVTFRCLNNEDWTMVFISDAVEQLTGYVADDFVLNNKRSYNSLVHPDDIANVRLHNSQTAPKDYTIEYRIIDKSGNIVWVNEKGTLYFDETEKRLLIDGLITNITDRKHAETKLLENQQQLLYKSEILAAIAKTTEKLLVSENIEETLNESFAEVGRAAQADRLYYFRNNIETNIINLRLEWVRDSIIPQIGNPVTQNLTFEDIYFYTNLLRENKIFQKTISDITDPTMKARWQQQSILSVLLIPVLVKNNFYGFIGIDDCTQEQRWSDDKLNLLQSLATNIANAIDRINNERIIRESESNFRQLTETMEDVFLLYDMINRKCIYVSPSCKRVMGADQQYFYSNKYNYVKDLLLEDYQLIGYEVREKLLKHNSAEVEFRIKTTDGQIRWIYQKSFGIKDASDKLVRISAIFTDITDQKAAEEKVVEAQKAAEAANKSKIELELRALQMQMNPHFVFNALNSIQSYVMNQDSLTANVYLSKFSRLIRLFLDSSRSKFIPLAEEISLLTLYMELEKIRFENKFDFEMTIDAHVNKYIEIPTMILQPFIENAINHGLRYKHQRGILSVRFYTEQGYLICKIEDDGVGRANANKIQSKTNKGYQSQGLKITTERLITYNKINDANIVFSISDKILNPKNPNDEVGTVIEIRFPEN